MPLNFSIVDNFIEKYRDTMTDRTLDRHERSRVLRELTDTLQSSLNEYLSFETEFRSLVMHRIESATEYGDLLESHRRAVAGVENFFLEEDSIVDVHDLFRIIRDAIIIRTLRLVEDELEGEGYGCPPVEYVWAGLGSEGRDEQTIITDQDNMIVYGESDRDFATDALRAAMGKKVKDPGAKISAGETENKALLDYYFEVFATRVTTRLNDVGFELCKGGVMPSFPKWRGSVADWKKRIEERMAFSRGDFEMLDIIIFSDARPITGNKTLLKGLVDFFFAKLLDNKSIIKEFVEAAVLMPTAITFFGNFKTEKSGENEGKINVKLTGWSPLILSVRLLAIVNGIYETNTIRRIKLLGARNIIKKDVENDLIDAYLIFVKFRLMNQVNNKDVPGMNLNYVDPGMLGEETEDKLRKAMKTVESFQKYIQELLLFGQPV